MTTTVTPTVHDVGIRTARRGDIYVARIACDCGDLDTVIEHDNSRATLLHLVAREYHRHIMHSDKLSVR